MRLATSRSLLFVLCLGSATASWAQPVLGSRLRCLDKDIARVLDRGKAVSPSARALAERIEQSDLIVYLRMDGLLTHRQGETRFITAARGARYVMVGLNPRAEADDLVAMLGHELQHVNEIAQAPGVRDGAAVEALFKRIGWPGLGPDTFETGSALEMGRQVAREVRAAGAVGHGARPTH